MDSAAINSFIPTLDQVDSWSEILTILPILIILELLLSADNAVALASLTKSLDSPGLRSKALNIGITISLLFRIFLILLSNILLKFIIIRIFAGLYLIYLFISNVFLIYESNIQGLDNAKTNNNFNELMTHRVHEILLVASPYDAFILEEEGGLTEQIMTEYIGMNFNYAPRVTRSSTSVSSMKHLSKNKFDLVIHMAAQPLVKYSYKKPLETFKTNIIGTANIFECSKLVEDLKGVLCITSDKCYLNTNNSWATTKTAISSVENAGYTNVSNYTLASSVNTYSTRKGLWYHSSNDRLDEGNNPVSKAKLVLNGNDRFSEREGKYFNLVQPYILRVVC